MARASAPGLALLLVALLCGSCSAQDRTVGSGYQAGLALINKQVTRIGISSNINLQDFSAIINALTSAGRAPLTIDRDLEFYNAASSQVTLDFAYFSGLAVVASGVTVTFTNLRLLRIAGGLPTAIFRTSEGATLAINGCEMVVAVCPPAKFTDAFFLQYNPRPSNYPGTQQVTTDPNTGSFELIDAVQQLSTFVQPGFGGHLDVYRNSKAVCQQQIPLTSAAECQNFANGGALDQYCVKAQVAAGNQVRCTLPECVNGCKLACSGA